MQRAFNCIFIGGIHGVGKSSLCAASSQELKIPHYVASDLIRKISDEDKFLHKEVKNLGRNQDALIRSIQRYVDETLFLLDGHFVIRATGEGLQPIPMETFGALQIKGIIVVTGDPMVASKRIEERDGKVISSALLEKMQIAEIEAATRVAQTLNTPLSILHSPNSSDFARTVSLMTFK